MNGDIWIFDTETTDTDDDRQVIEAAAILIEREQDMVGGSDRIVLPWDSRESWDCRYRPTKPISFGAMAVHHILPHELENRKPHDECRIPKSVDYLVGHNIDFDWEAVGRPDVRRIDTDAMARWVWPDADSYSQSALLYMVLGPTEDTRNLLKDAHSALADVEANLLLLSAILHERPELRTWTDLYAYSEQCRIPRVCPFRQHKGIPWDDVAMNDPGFCDWVLRQDWIDDYLRVAVTRAMGYD